MTDGVPGASLFGFRYACNAACDSPLLPTATLRLPSAVLATQEFVPLFTQDGVCTSGPPSQRVTF